MFRKHLSQSPRKSIFMEQDDPSHQKLCYNSVMKVGILGYGKEGKSAEQYFQQQGAETVIFDNFTNDDLKLQDFSSFDLVLRSPSVHPQPQFSSATRYFFDHCPCPIIGVTGTKGKGTTCTLITDLFKSLGENAYLVGNIGNPALDVLDQLKPTDIVVYEMSSFQLWDLEKSPHIAVVLRIEPDHLNVHDSYDDYVNAKANIVKHQSPADFCIYFQDNPDTARIATQSPAQKLTYPTDNPTIAELTQHLAVPGQHNRENAEAALLAVASYYNLPIKDFITKHHDAIITTFENFRGLPHRLQYLRELNGVKYYDDNFSTTPTSLKVALEAFPEQQIILIAGGRDKTDNQDLPEIIRLIQNYATKTVLIGESGHEIAKILTNIKNSPVVSDTELANILETTTDNRFFLAPDLSQAVTLAKDLAASLQSQSDQNQSTIVLMSPAAASFDMFTNVYDRGAQFQKLVQDLS